MPRRATVSKDDPPGPSASKKSVKKRAAKPDTPNTPRRKRQRPSPVPVGMSDLPAEVLGIIAFYLSPPFRDRESGIISPFERPYDSRFNAITAHRSFRAERFGVVPRGLLDVLNMGRCSHSMYRAALPYIGPIYGSRKSVPSKKPADTVDATSDSASPSASREGNDSEQSTSEQKDTDKSAEGGSAAAKSLDSETTLAEATDEVPRKEKCRATKRTMYLRMEHRNDTADDLFKDILGQRETLEELIIHNCGTHDDNKSRGGRSEYAVPRTGLTISTPLQDLAGDDVVPLPNLRHLQLGPHLCYHCIHTLLRIFTDKTFMRIQGSGSGGSTTWSLGQSIANHGFWADAKKQYKHYPTPSLTSVQIMMPDVYATNASSEPDRLQSFARSVSLESAKKIQVFSLVLRDSLDKRWGGFGISGGSSRLSGTKTVKEVDDDLTERVRNLGVPADIREQRKAREEKERSVIANRYRREIEQARSAAGKSSADDDIASAAKAAVQSIKDAKGKGKVKEEGDQTLASLDPDAREPPRPSSDNRDKPNGSSAHGRARAQNHLRMEDQLETILRTIAERFTGLKSLQVVRAGAFRVDVVEAPDSLNRMFNACVRPLCSLKQLQYLDLGLAVAGERELCDFPIGLSFPIVNQADLTNKADRLAQELAREKILRKRLYEADVIKAVKEGDAWRKRVIERFALGLPVEDGDTGSEAVTWPRGVKRGFVYSPDLLERRKYRGFLTSWEKDVVGGQEVLKWSRHNVML